MKYSEFYRLIEQHGWTIKGAGLMNKTKKKKKDNEKD